METAKVSMQGGGYYNENCTVQGMAIDKALDLLLPVDYNGESLWRVDFIYVLGLVLATKSP